MLILSLNVESTNRCFQKGEGASMRPLRKIVNINDKIGEA